MVVLSPILLLWSSELSLWVEEILLLQTKVVDLTVIGPSRVQHRFFLSPGVAKKEPYVSNDSFTGLSSNIFLDTLLSLNKNQEKARKHCRNGWRDRDAGLPSEVTISKDGAAGAKEYNSNNQSHRSCSTLLHMKAY